MMSFDFMECNVIYNEDCLTGMKRIPDNSVDAIICDLPYNNTRNKWDKMLPLDLLWDQYKRIIKPNGIVLLFSQNLFTGKVIMSNPAWFRYTLVWHKNQPSGFLNARRMPLRSHEDICVFYNKMPVYHPIMGKGVRKVSSAASKVNCVKTHNYSNYNFVGYDSTDRFPTSVLNFAKDTQKCAIHPTQKPVALIEYLIRTYTDEGALVVDNCMGSGTTAVAALHTGRRYIGFELDADYWRAACNRVYEEKKKQNQ